MMNMGNTCFLKKKHWTVQEKNFKAALSRFKDMYLPLREADKSRKIQNEVRQVFIVYL